MYLAKWRLMKEKLGHVGGISDSMEHAKNRFEFNLSSFMFFSQNPDLKLIFLVLSTGFWGENCFF